MIFPKKGFWGLPDLLLVLFSNTIPWYKAINQIASWFNGLTNLKDRSLVLMTR